MTTATEDGTFSVEFSRDGGMVVLHAIGEMDLEAVGAMDRALVDVVDGQGCLSVRIDLARVTFIDSSGLSLLVRTKKRLEAKGGRLEVTEPKPGTAQGLRDRPVRSAARPRTIPERALAS